ncbi:hypothetical protein ACJX0J_036479 [Zea mays]
MKLVQGIEEKAIGVIVAQGKGILFYQAANGHYFDMSDWEKLSSRYLRDICFLRKLTVKQSHHAGVTGNFQIYHLDILSTCSIGNCDRNHSIGCMLCTRK